MIGELVGERSKIEDLMSGRHQTEGALKPGGLLKGARLVGGIYLPSFLGPFQRLEKDRAVGISRELWNIPKVKFSITKRYRRYV